MKINRENYEPYFIDLLDGTLSNEMVDELLDFLRLNPDLAEELKGLEGIQLPLENLPKYDHQKLLKSGLDQSDVFNETCIRYLENDLSEKEEKELQLYLSKHTKAKAEYNLFKATISEPDLMVVYPNKDALKHRLKILPLWYAAAAVVLLGILFWFNLPQSTTVENVAQLTPIINEQPTVKIDEAPLKNNFAKVENIEPKVEVQKPEPVQTAATRNEEIIEPLQANLSIPEFKNQTDNSFALATVPAKAELNETEYYPTVPELIAQEVNKIDWKKGMQKVSHFTLNKLRQITDDKLDYSSKPDGEVTKIEYNSRLLAFSVPVNSKNN